MRPLFILRPEPSASASVARAEAMGLEAVKFPLFEIRPLPWTAPDPGGFDAILITSANAAQYGGPELARLKALPVHAVGEATAAAARDAGFSVASVGTGSVEDLMAALPSNERLLHLAGRDHHASGALETIHVYESAELPPPNGLKQLKEAVIAVHSPRAGRRLAELVKNKSRIAIAAISAAAAKACGPGWERVEVVEAPNDPALLALAAWLCNKPNR